MAFLEYEGNRPQAGQHAEDVAEYRLDRHEHGTEHRQQQGVDGLIA
jgi:hypothetical protein